MSAWSPSTKRRRSGDHRSGRTRSIQASRRRARRWGILPREAGFPVSELHSGHALSHLVDLARGHLRFRSGTVRQFRKIHILVIPVRQPEGGLLLLLAESLQRLCGKQRHHLHVGDGSLRIARSVGAGDERERGDRDSAVQPVVRLAHRGNVQHLCERMAGGSGALSTTFTGLDTEGTSISSGVSLSTTMFAVPPNTVVAFEVALSLDYNNDSGDVEADFESGNFQIACPVVVYSLLNSPPGAAMPGWARAGLARSNRAARASIGS
jgi:hypothetical protein